MRNRRAVVPQEWPVRSLAFDRLAAETAVLDGRSRIVDTNEAWRLFARLNDGLPRTTGIGASYLEVCDRSAAAGDVVARRVATGLREVLAGERMHFDLEYSCPSPLEDRWFLLQVSSTTVDGAPGAVVMHVDITARKTMETLIHELSESDRQTGLPVWGRTRHPEPARGTRAGDAAAAAVVLVDLVDRSAVAEQFGHDVRDELLVKAASRMRRAAGLGEVSRAEGGRFVIEGNGWDRAVAEQVVVQLRDALSRPYQAGADAISLGAAIGLATSGGAGGMGADDLLAVAEEDLAADVRRTDERSRNVMDLADRLASANEAPPGPGGAASSQLLVDQLRAAQAMTDAVLAHSQDIVMMCDPDGTITWVSPSLSGVLVVPPSALIGRNGFEIIHPDDRDRVLADLTCIPELGDHVRTEFRIVLGDTTWCFEAIATNLLDEPNVGQIVSNLRDVTDRKAAEAEIHLQSILLAAAGQAIVATDGRGGIIYWNDAAEALFGWTSSEALGQQVRTLLRTADPTDAPTLAAADRIIAGEAWEGELDVRVKGGGVVPILTTARPVLDGDGSTIGMTVVSMDNTEQVRRRAATEEARRRLAVAQASANLGSFEIDLASGIVTRSDELSRILGVDPGEPAAMTDELVHPEDRARVAAAMANALAGQPSASCTHRIVRPDGTTRWVVSRSSQVRHAGSAILAGTMLDITEQHEAELALAHLANHDSLTGLPNRRLLVEALQSSLERSGESDRRTGVVFIDLDDFKVVNDRFGHVDGDDILRFIGDRLGRAVAEGDTIARLGGDEFVVCCDDVVDVQDLRVRAARLQTSLGEPLVVGSQSHRLTASVGMALSVPGMEAEELLRNADAAMYAAKQGGGARVELFDELLYADLRRRQELAAEIASALDHGQFQTHFQPEVALRTGTLVGFEALARWEHPERGMLSPAEFIEIAEGTGTVTQLGRQVLADGCRALASWLDTSPEQRLSVAINVSPLQLADPTFPDDVRDAIQAAGVPAGRVCLEVTESALMDPDVAVEALRNLKAVGVAIAIDDFGTGYSSLSRLKRFPVDLLKIDRSFVDGLGSDPEDEVIVATVINLARSLGIDVIAEGVETQDQLDLLASYGCELGQGYLWSPALPPDEAARYAASVDVLAYAAPALEGPEPTRQQRTDTTSTVAHLVHELATPLTVIGGYADLARHLPGPEDTSLLDTALGAIERAAADMAEILSAMANTRALDEGTLAFDRHVVDVPRLLSELVAERSMAEGRNPITLSPSEPADAYIDAAWTRQIFTNLLTNAETWSPPNTPIEVRVALTDHAIHVSVVDRGPGVASDRIGDLFRKFSRPDRSNTGTGLGLYIARQLARTQEGDIRYRRADGGGSEFIVELPRSDGHSGRSPGRSNR